jgi:hypothetical protein
MGSCGDGAGEEMEMMLSRRGAVERKRDGEAQEEQ